MPKTDIEIKAESKRLAAIKEKVKPALDEFREDLAKSAALKRWAKEVAEELAR